MAENGFYSKLHLKLNNRYLKIFLFLVLVIAMHCIFLTGVLNNIFGVWKCPSFITEKMSDTTISQFYSTCAFSRHHRSLQTGPELFQDLFTDNLFKDVKCGNVSKSFLSGEDRNRPLVALPSLPGSGNTWTRILLDEMTGIYTGSIYADRLSYKVLHGSTVCPVNNTFIVKTHARDNIIHKKKCNGIKNLDFRKAIYIARNPYHAILAEFNRKAGKVKVMPRETFLGRGWTTHVSRFSTKYYDHMTYWLTKFPHPIYLLIYERLEKNLLWELYKVAQFIDFPVTFETMWCIKQRTDTQATYKRQKPDWLKPEVLYNSKMKKEINKRIDQIMNGTGKMYHIQEYLQSCKL